MTAQTLLQGDVASERQMSLQRWMPFQREDRLMLSIGLYGSLFLTLFVPILLIVIWSLVSMDYGWFAPDLFPEALAMDYWREIFATGNVMGSVILSLTIAGIVTLATSLLALPTAYALARFPFKLKRAVEIYVLAPMIVPGIVVATGLGELFFRIGLNQTIIGVILAQIVGTLPLMIRLLTATLESIPSDVLYAARMLGANPLRMVLYIVVPMAMPGFVAGGLLTFIGSFDEFDKTFIVGAPMIQTLPVRLFNYIDGGSIIFPLASVVALLLLIPMVVIFYLAGRIARDDVLASGMGKL